MSVAIMLLVGVVGLSISLVTAKNSGLFAGELISSSFQVSNLSCGSCLGTIEQELRQYDGMVTMDADLASGLVTIGHTKAFPEQAIAVAIAEAGYPARIIGDRDKEFLRNRPATGAGSGCGSGCGSRGCGLPQQIPPEG